MRLRYPALLGRLLLTGLLLGSCALAPAAELPYTDTWKVKFLFPGQDVSLYLVKLTEKDGKLHGELISAGLAQFKGSEVKEARVGEDKSLHLTIEGAGATFTVSLHPGKDGEKSKKMLGSVEFRGQRQFAQIERTEDKELDPSKAIVNSSAVRDLFSAINKDNAKEKVAALKEFIDKNGDNVALVYSSRIELLKALIASSAPADDLRSQADQLIKLAGAYGPEMKIQATQEAARQLVSAKDAGPAALEYARQAEKSLGKSAAPQQQAAVLKTLAHALRKADRKDEAREIAARIATIDGQLDQEFLKTAIPFKPETFTGRKGKSDRVVLVELFTGAQCPPCVSADIAFDAAIETYKPKDVVFLEYHLHIPGPDPLTNKDSEVRSNYYRIQGTPTVYIDGKEGTPLGGGKPEGKARYETLTKGIDEQLEAVPQAKLKLTAERLGDTIAIRAEAAELKKDKKEGKDEKKDEDEKDLRLRLVIVEEVVRFPGGNGQRLHNHVVRAMPGGVDGATLKDGSAKQDLKVSATELHQTLNDYLANFGKGQVFQEDDRPLDLKHLKVVALVQDHKTKEVLQTAQVDLGDGK